MSDRSAASAGYRSLTPRRRMIARNQNETHRASTPLELLFDLCFVVAVARAGSLLAHSLAEGQVTHGLLSYLFVFFAIWWAWMNFTWFASAYDTDDPLYRVATFVQIAGVLVLAAGIPQAFERADYSIAVAGYLIMRVALTAQWLRAARNSDGAQRLTSLRYAVGLIVVEIGWIALLWLPHHYWYLGFAVMALADVAVPVIAERTAPTSWHPRHIAERYGLFTIIVLGESIAAAALAVQVALSESTALLDLLPVAIGGLLIVFAAYWIYFAVPIHTHLTSNRRAFLWGYGHYAIFLSAAAVGAGLEVAIEEATHQAHTSTLIASASVTVPTSVFLLTVWLLHSRFFKRGLADQLVLPVSAALVLAATFAGHWAVPTAGLITAATIAIGTALDQRSSGVAQPLLATNQR